MFKKYQYTCPDVIHIRKVARRRAITAIAVQTVVLGVCWIMMNAEERESKVTELDPNHE